jgi:hypothetical protein
LDRPREESVHARERHNLTTIPKKVQVMLKLKVNFLSDNCYWEKKVSRNADLASDILSDPAFIAKVASWPHFDYCVHSPAQVAKLIENAGDVFINVGFYSKRWTKAIAYEVDAGIFFNTRKEAYGAGDIGNLVHEVMHKLGLSHNGNSSSGNENTAPYRIGQWASEWSVAKVQKIAMFQAMGAPVVV